MSGWPNLLGVRLQSSDGCCCEIKSHWRQLLSKFIFPGFFCLTDLLSDFLSDLLIVKNPNVYCCFSSYLAMMLTSKMFNFKLLMFGILVTVVASQRQGKKSYVCYNKPKYQYSVAFRNTIQNFYFYLSKFKCFVITLPCLLLNVHVY